MASCFLAAAATAEEVSLELFGYFRFLSFFGHGSRKSEVGSRGSTSGFADFSPDAVSGFWFSACFFAETSEEEEEEVALDLLT